MKKAIIISVIIIHICSSAFTQVVECASKVSSQQVDFENSFTDSISEIQKLHRTFHLTFHVVKDEAGETGIDLNMVEPAVSAMNAAFQPIGVAFKFSTIKAIDNFNYNTVYYNNTDNELIDISYNSNTINVYLVEKLYDEEGKITCSYTFFPSESKDVMFIQKSCFDDIRLIHLAGHFFNLYHTHEDVFGSETVDGSGCENNGDLCCDTEAAPNLEGQVNDVCEYEGEAKDANGAYYYPSTKNYMSFAPVECRCFFSEDQYVRMINAIVKLKTHLW